MINKATYAVSGDVGIPNLLHFVYKSRSTSQYTSPELEAPYNNPQEEERLVCSFSKSISVFFVILSVFLSNKFLACNKESSIYGFCMM